MKKPRSDQSALYIQLPLTRRMSAPGVSILRPCGVTQSNQGTSAERFVQRLWASRAYMHETIIGASRTCPGYCKLSSAVVVGRRSHEEKGTSTTHAAFAICAAILDLASPARVIDHMTSSDRM